MSIPPHVYRSDAACHAAMARYDALLNQWLTPYESLFVPTRAGETHVIAGGDPAAPPLLLLHGAAVSALMWSLNAPALNRRFRTYAPDIPGEGGKSDGVRMPRQGKEHADWLADVFDALHLDSAFVAGVSLGGWLTLHFAAHHPARVRRIAPMCPAGLLPLSPGFLWKAALAQVFPSARTVRGLFRYISAPGRPLREEFISLYIEQFKTARPGVRVPSALDDALLRGVRTPTLLLVGAHEVLYDPHAAVERARRLLPDVRAEVVPGAGHAISSDQPDVVNDLLTTFFGA